MRTPTAVILTESDALDLLRPLGREGIQSIVLSQDPTEISSSSRYCRKVFRIDSFAPHCDEQNIKTLISIARSEGRKLVLFYGGDSNMLFVSRNREQLSEFYHFLLPSRDLADKLVNKTSFQRLAEEIGLPIPSCSIVYSLDELITASQTIEYPVIAKPAFAAAWVSETPAQLRHHRTYKHALRRFETAEAMNSFCHEIPFDEDGVLVQQFVDGNELELVSFHGYFDENSNLLGCFVGRKIRTSPPLNGGSSFIETIHDSEVVELGIRAMQAIGFQGIVKIDMKRNHRDRSLMILEVNPRYNLWEHLGAFAGVNLLTLAYHHQRGDHIPRIKSDYSSGYKWIFLKEDLRAFLSYYWKSGEWPLLRYLKSLRGKKVYKVFDWSDPLPLAFSLFHFLSRRITNLSHLLARMNKRAEEVSPSQVGKG